MTPGLLMLIAGVVFVCALIVLLVNFARIAKDPSIMLEGKGTTLHLVSGAVTSVSGLVLIAGFVWFLVERVAR